MVIFYSWKGHTKAYAKALSELSGDNGIELTEKKTRSGALGFLSGCWQSIFKKESQINEPPSLKGVNEIYVCSPVWASGIAPAVRAFINHADLKGKTVNFVLTCASIEKHEEYQKAAFDSLNGTNSIRGAAYVFACPMKSGACGETIRDHIKKVILGMG